MKIAFSTVCCPELSVEDAIASAARWGFQGLEMRLAPKGVGASEFACDPMAINAGQLHDLFEDAGVDPVGLATGITFDKQVWPPVVGRLFQSEEIGVPETKAAVEQAAEAGIAHVRVFGERLGAGEPAAWGWRRVSERLALASQTARNTNTRVLIENSGSFARAADLKQLHDMVGRPHLAMSYSVLAAVQEGECPMDAIGSIIDGTEIVRIGDIAEDGRPVPLGEGTLPIEAFVGKLKELNYRGWIVYEYPRLWRTELVEAEAVLPGVAEMLYGWAGRTTANA
ncbi:MAG: sugar phosphate isomerase/epimerase family protein [Phycisphaerales bacterium]